MTTPQTEIDSLVAASSTEAFKIFCRDMSAMFDMDMDSKQKDLYTETADGLKKRFTTLTTLMAVRASGRTEGTFHLIFDQDGLFTLAGAIVMQPKQRILENRKKGTIKEANDVRDAMKEAGNMLIGSLNKAFGSAYGGKIHFLQADTFIGLLSDNIGAGILPCGAELLFISYEISLGAYPAFQCGVIFPKDMLVKF